MTRIQPGLAGAALCLLLAGAAQAEPIAAESYYDALAQAKGAGQLVIIDFYTDW
ncbi:MAG: hypothetical protein ABIK96_01470 [bacterium]